MVPEKVGLKAVTRDGLDYEMTLVFDIDIKHQATASKDRTGLFADKPQKTLGVMDGMLLKEWCETEISVEQMVSKISQCNSVAALNDLYKKHPAFQEKLLSAFKAQRDIIESKKAPQHH
jgi:hypothetical protein